MKFQTRSHDGDALITTDFAAIPILQKRGAIVLNVLVPGPTDEPRGAMAQTADDVDQPTYQEYQVPPKGDEMQVYLVGQEGPCHWATTVRLRATDERGIPEVFVGFDVAVRSRVPLDRVRASYLITAPPAHLEWQMDSGVCVGFDGGVFQFVMERDPEAPEGTRIDIEPIDDRSMRACATFSAPKLSRSLRLMYGFIISDYRATPSTCGLSPLRSGGKE